MTFSILGSVLVALAALTGSAAANAGDPAAPAEDPGKTGHERMTQQLRRIHEQSRYDNPYLGRKIIDEYEAKLAELPADRPDLRAWYFHSEIGRNELRMGNVELGLVHYNKAYRHLLQFADEVPVEEALDTVFQLGVAYMRLGESQNCVARHTSDSCILPIRKGGVHVNRQGAQKAVEKFSEVLKHAQPGSYHAVKASWLLNIAYMTLGEYPAGVPQPWRVDPSTFESDESIPRFVDIAPKLGLNSMDLSGGAAAEDFDGDGFLDIVTSTLDTGGQVRLFHNNGNGSFSDRTDKSGLVGILGGLNLTTADYDNDGDVDVLVLRGAWFGKRGRHPNSLLRNAGDGTFEDVTFQAGLGQVHYPTQTAAWADYDNDGDLDLYIGNESAPEISAPGQLFRNNGKGAFVDVAKAAGVENERFAKGVVWGDFDGDRFPDLYVSNMGQDNRMYHNNGDGTFDDVAPELKLIGPRVSFPTWFWDFNNDGALDLFVGAYGNSRQPDVADVAASYLGLRHRAEIPHLYQGDGKGGFREVARERNLSLASLPMGSNFGDFDYDGYPDFYLGTGYPYYEALMPNVMYRNVDGERFADVTTSGGFGHLQKGHAVVFADLDHDGDQDIYEQIGGAYPGDAFGNALFDNPGFGNHWIKVGLVGVRSNRFGVGARIRVLLDEGEGQRIVHRTVGTGGSFGANPLRQEIGLGQAKRIRRLEVYWPSSDRTQVFDDLAADRWIRITENQDQFEVMTHKKSAP